MNGPAGQTVEKVYARWHNYENLAEFAPQVRSVCRTEADVMHAVKYARENQLIVAIRGGGHNLAGRLQPCLQTRPLLAIATLIARIKTASIVPPSSMHSAYNLILVLWVYTYST